MVDARGPSGAWIAGPSARVIKRLATRYNVRVFKIFNDSLARELIQTTRAEHECFNDLHMLRVYYNIIIICYVYIIRCTIDWNAIKSERRQKIGIDNKIEKKNKLFSVLVLPDDRAPVRIS